MEYPLLGHFINSNSAADKQSIESTTSKVKDKSTGVNAVKDEMLDADGIKIEVEPVVVLNTSLPAYDTDILKCKSQSKEEILPAVKENQENGKEINEELEENHATRDESNLVEDLDDLNDCEGDDDDLENEEKIYKSKWMSYLSFT